MKKIIAILAFVLSISAVALATVSDTESPVKVYSSGTATSYTIPFDYISDSDITVTLVNSATGAETAQTLDVDYTITGSAVIYSVAPGSGYKVVIQRETPYTQEASFSSGEAPPLTTYESAYDKLTYLAQDLDERLKRAPLLPASAAMTDIEWPNFASNAGKLVRINTDGDGLEAIATVAAGSALDVTAYCDAADLALLHSVGTTSLRGYTQRSKFAYSDADTITIGPGIYQHSGTVDQLVYWDSTLSFDSTDADTHWYYLYIDDSAIVVSGTNALTASELTSSTTAPSWSNAKHGWYNGLDRCIFAYYVASGSIKGFIHDGGNYIGHISTSEGDFKQSGNLSDGSAYNADADIPAFSTFGKFEVRMSDEEDDWLLVGEERYYLVYGVTTPRAYILDAHTTSAQKLYMLSVGSIGGTWTHWLRTLGWYFPAGM